MISVIVGAGEIGQAVASVISRLDKVISYDIRDGEMPDVSADILHVCFPYNDESFIDSVKAYIFHFKVIHVIIWSTVPIGTTEKIKGAVHSPVEGVHPDLELSIRSMVRWIGANDSQEAKFFENYFREMYLKVRVVDDTKYTEFLKLRSTSKYGINLVWADYEHKITEKMGMDFKLVRDFDQDYNKLYHNLGKDWAQRYILHPPRGKIGGHCIVPNAKLLNEQYPDDLLSRIIAMEKK